MTEIVTLLDAAHAAVSADPENEALRLRFFERLADGEMVILLEREAAGESIEPKVFDLEDGPVVLVFDREERLADFSGGIAPYAALPGRVIAGLLKGQGIGMGVNLGVASVLDDVTVYAQVVEPPVFVIGGESAGAHLAVLTLLRLLAAALVIFAAAGPILNPQTGGTRTSGPLLIMLDDGWSAAASWDLRIKAADELIASAENDRRGVAAPAGGPLRHQRQLPLHHMRRAQRYILRHQFADAFAQSLVAFALAGRRDQCIHVVQQTSTRRRELGTHHLAVRRGLHVLVIE